MSELLKALGLIKEFKGNNLGLKIATLENEFEGCDSISAAKALVNQNISGELVLAAVVVKRASAQIDEILHAVGILLCLPEILEPGERVECLSLGAGNTGRSYDLETDRRIAELTFIEWKGGSESIRKQKLFKDFYTLAETESTKERFLYFVGDTHAPKVFQSRSACFKMLKKFADLRAQFCDRYEATLPVKDYYQAKKHLVKIVDLNGVAPKLAEYLK